VTPPRPKRSNHPLAINDVIKHEDDMIEALERIRRSLIDGDENLNSSATYVKGLLERYDKKVKGRFGTKVRVGRVANPIFQASELLMDGAALIKRAANSFVAIYVNDAPTWEDEFTIRGGRR
jgi:Mg2+ and Co2+ transporter CorA